MMIRTIVRFVFWISFTIGAMLATEAIGRVIMALYK
jgi:hypothetical protein